MSIGCPETTIDAVLCLRSTNFLQIEGFEGKDAYVLYTNLNRKTLKVTYKIILEKSLESS